MLENGQLTFADLRDESVAETSERTEADDLGTVGRELAVGKHEGIVSQLVPLARELAEIRPGGITVSDVRELAEKRGVELHGNLSCLGSVMSKAGLKPTQRMRRSHIKSTHGRHQRVWVR